MKTVYKVTFTCGHSGTDEVHFVRANSLSEVENWATESFPDYISDWEHLVTWSPENMDEEEYSECGEDCEEACFYDSQEYEDYVADCSFDITEATEKDYFNWSVEDRDIEDIIE